MENNSDLMPTAEQAEKTIPLKKALLILAAITGVIVIAGLIIGYLFFWGKYQQQTYEDVVLEAAQHRVKASPKDATAHLQLGYAYLLRNEVDKGLKEYKIAYELDPKNRQVRYNLALGHIANNQYGEAIKLLHPLAKEGIFDFDSHYSLGEAYYLNKQYPEAVKAFSEAVSIRPGYANAYYYMALAYKEMGDKQNAIGAADKALRLVPKYKEVLDLKAELTGQPAGGEKREP